MTRTLAGHDRDEQQTTLDCACRAIAKGREYQVREIKGGGYSVISPDDVVFGIVTVTTDAKTKKVTISW